MSNWRNGFGWYQVFGFNGRWAWQYAICSKRVLTKRWSTNTFSDSVLNISTSAWFEIFPWLEIYLHGSNYFFQELFTVLEHFKKYHHVWKTDRHEVLEDFRSKSSLVGEYEQEMLRYKALVDDISSEPQIISAGPVAVHTGWVNHWASH